MVYKLMMCGIFFLCTMLGRMSVRSTDGVLFMAIDLSCSARIYAQKRGVQSALHNALPRTILHT